MKKSDILKAVENIKMIANDDEIAHHLEDGLREQFIKYVAMREDDLGEKARIVLSTNDIKFARWCA